VAALRPGNVFFDIGANVGYYSLLGARLVGPRGRVVALEPVVRNVAFLHRHIVLNKAGNVDRSGRVLGSHCSLRSLTGTTMRPGGWQMARVMGAALCERPCRR
jgi:FkbM family methyltransferase